MGVALDLFEFEILEILKREDKGPPPFISTTLPREGSKSNVFRDILAKVYSFNSL